MEYRWKEITKMGEISAKTYSIWNGQIPCGIRGQGKDLGIWRCMQWPMVEMVMPEVPMRS